MTFVPPKPRFLLEKKRNSLKFNDDIASLQSNLISSIKETFPEIKSTLPSMRNTMITEESTTSLDGFPYAELTERARNAIEHYEKVRMQELQLIPSRESIMDESAFITNLQNEEKKKEKPAFILRQPKFKNLVLQPMPRPPEGSDLSVIVINGLLRTVWDVEGIKTGLEQAKEGIKSYGAELREIRDQLRSINRYSKEKTEAGIHDDLMVAMENTFRRMEENSEFKFGKLVHSRTDTYNRLKRYSSVDRGLMRKPEKITLPKIVIKDRGTISKIMPKRERSKPHFLSRENSNEVKVHTIRGFLK